MRAPSAACYAGLWVCLRFCGHRRATSLCGSQMADDCCRLRVLALAGRSEKEHRRPGFTVALVWCAFLRCSHALWTRNFLRN